MRKTLAIRIAGLAAIYCVVFCILVIIQFSNSGSFLLSAGEMTIRGRYLQTLPHETSSGNETGDGVLKISGGARVYYGGLDFNLSEERGKGLTLTSTEGVITHVNPDYLILTDNTALFGLPDGTTILFNSFDSIKGRELQINAELAENISEITIPITLRRSSLIHDNGQLSIMYGGSRYSFSSQSQYLENGIITLSRENAFISYRSREKQNAFEPADYIIAQSQNYENELLNWRDLSYARWNQNISALQNEDDVIAYCSEAFIRGNYTAAVAAIPSDFINSTRHTFRSSGFIGGMSNAYRSFTSSEDEKLNLITMLTRQRSLDVLKEEHVLDYLFSRGNAAVANDIIDIIRNASPEMLAADYCPGLLEAYSDIRLWRPSAENLIEHLTDQILSLVSDNLNRDTERDLVFVSNSEGINYYFSLRIGKAIVAWTETNQNAQWRAIGQSLVLSALTEAGAGTGKLYNALKFGDHHPRAALLTDTGHWAWTVSSSIRASYVSGNLNITLSFPTAMTHHILIRGVRPFIKLQIHGMDWRTDSQFERYDSSGWIYYPEEQILILKLRHRTTVETVTVFYRAEEPPPVREIVETEAEEW
ncbi:MAG: hypothetical protein LBQ93_10820 [Treponema sp.]|jgi:hypothetical protein|nr:hypothetical protein [Treponema sp.]